MLCRAKRGEGKGYYNLLLHRRSCRHQLHKLCRLHVIHFARAVALSCFVWVVQDAAQAIEGMKAAHGQQTMWLRVKAALLANLSRKVRQELAEARSHAAELEVTAVRKEVAGLQDLLQQQQHFAATLEEVFQASIC